MLATSADTGDLEQATGFRPHTPVEAAVAKFVDWYKVYYRSAW